MRRSRRPQAPYSANHIPPRRRRPRATRGTFRRRAFSSLQSLIVTLLHVLLFPFAALASLFRPRKRRPPAAAPLAAAADGSVEAIPSVAALRGKRAGAPSPNMRPAAFRALNIALAVLFACSGLFLGWALIYSDPSIPVTVTANGATRTILTKAGTVGEVLSANGIALREGDALNYATDSSLTPGMQVTVQPAFPVAVASGENAAVFYMREGTVGEALARAGISYDSDDGLTALPYADVTPGMYIRHTDVSIQYENVDDVIEYNEEVIKDPDTYIGIDHVRTEGEDGARRIVRRLTYIDGALSSREIVNQIILKEPVDKVTVEGSKIRYQTGLTGDTRIWKAKPTADQIKKKIVVTDITAYTATGYKTATGRWPRIGYVAVNPNVIPYGTKLYIPGYGYCTAQDTGAFRNEEDGMKNQIDLYMETERECVKWGRKHNVTVYILK